MSSATCPEAPTAVEAGELLRSASGDTPRTTAWCSPASCSLSTSRQLQQIPHGALGDQAHLVQVPAVGAAAVRNTLETAFGKKVEDLFEDFDFEPIAAASLGQVHLATLDGRRVVVKVQRPGLRELFRVDLKNVRVIAQWLQVRITPPPAPLPARLGQICDTVVGGVPLPLPARMCDSGSIVYCIWLVHVRDVVCQIVGMGAGEEVSRRIMSRRDMRSSCGCECAEARPEERRRGA